MSVSVQSVRPIPLPSLQNLQRLLQPDSADPGDETQQPSDPLQALFQAFSGGQSSDPLVAAVGQDSSGAGSPQQLSSDVLKTLLSVQGQQGNPAAADAQSLVGKFDADGDGQISQSEFETAIGPGADQAKVDELFKKLDGNGDGSVSQDELQSALQKAHGGGHHAHHGPRGAGQQGGDPLQALLSGASTDGATSQSATNSDGSSTTTVTYPDGTKIEMTTPAASASVGTASPNPEAQNFANLLKQLISLQAQLATPTTNLSV